MILILASSVALAGSTGGIGVSPLGGGLAGVSEPGALGVGTNPAAAATDAHELAIDTGLVSWNMEATLEGEAAISSSGLVPQPSLAAVVDLGRFGLGFSGSIPYGGGGSFPADGPQRFHLTEAKVLLAEADLALGFQATKTLRLGVAGRVGKGVLQKHLAYDTGGLLTGMLGADAGIPLGDPFFEGTQTMDLAGVGLGYAAGLTVNIADESWVSAAYRSPIYVAMDGSITLVPSKDLDLLMDGDAAAELGFPREFTVGAQVPMGPLRLIGEVGWVGFSTLHAVDGNMSNLTVRSEDGLTMALLDSRLSDSDFLDEQSIKSTLGNVDIFHGGGAIEYIASETWRFRSGAWWAPTTIPDENFHLGAGDFDALDVRLVAQHSLGGWLHTAISVDHYLTSERTITTSALSLAADPDTGMVLPSGNGRYAMEATRVGLTLRIQESNR